MTYKFIDLFAGIGGFHLALHNLGAECVFASEWDEHARKTYELNFKNISPKLFESGNYVGDITKVDKASIPDFDILCAGFPCQPFSQAGHKLGFDDTRGTLFFDIVQILKIKKPKAFFLENVRGLLKHDHGKTFEVIKNTLTKELGYSLNYSIVKASEHGLPQHRPRLFMIGFRNPETPFQFPAKRELQFNMSHVMKGKVDRAVGFTLRVGGGKSPIDDRRNWDAYLVDGEIRRLGVEEGKMMMGFPKNYNFPVAKGQAMKQLGNSVAVNAIEAVAEQMVAYIATGKKKKQLNDLKNHVF
jgi:DNA (cytosine-5)-methyltransferase 1